MKKASEGAPESYENMLVASSVTLPYKLVCRARRAAKEQGLSLSKWLVPVIAEKLNKIPSSAELISPPTTRKRNVDTQLGNLNSSKSKAAGTNYDNDN